MRNIQALIAALRRAKRDGMRVDISGTVFTVENVDTLLGELYEMLARAQCSTSSR